MRIVCLSMAVLLFGCQPVNKDKQREREDKETLVNLWTLATVACYTEAGRAQAGRSFTSSFESVSEFSSFYSVPQNYQGVDTHGQSTAQVRTGTYSHVGTINGAGPSCPSWQNCNHRGYPTVQLYKTASGSQSGLIFIEFYVYLSGVTINNGEWFSFATLSADASDNWSRVVLANIGRINGSSQNFMHLMHVPLTGQSGWTYQNTNSANQFPMNTWTKVSICLNLHPANGYAKLWQNGVLMSEAPVQGACGVLHQAHFGLYAPPTLSTGSVYNDDLQIREVSVCPY